METMVCKLGWQEHLTLSDVMSDVADVTFLITTGSFRCPATFSRVD